MTTHKAMVTDAAVERMDRWLAKNEGLDPDLEGSHFHEDPVWMEFADDAREALALAQAETKPVAWQPIETAPKDGTKILGIIGDDTAFICRWLLDEDNEPESGEWCEYDTDVVHPRWWMPLYPLASPVPAKREAGVVVDAATVIAIRDALVASDIEEAWHQLYSAVDPQFQSYTPWAEVERSALSTSSTPADGEDTTKPVPHERLSTHHVHRGPESLPCYCAASSDHSIGQEQELPTAPSKEGSTDE